MDAVEWPFSVWPSAHISEQKMMGVVHLYSRMPHSNDGMWHDMTSTPFYKYWSNATRWVDNLSLLILVNSFLFILLCDSQYLFKIIIYNLTHCVHILEIRLPAEEKVLWLNIFCFPILSFEEMKSVLNIVTALEFILILTIWDRSCSEK